jgi:DNA polymerase type B, organellar and viral
MFYFECRDDNILGWVDNCLTELVNHIRWEMNPHDRVGLQFTSLSFPEKPFYVSMRLVDQLNKDVILGKLNDILQSNQNFFLNDWLNIFITHVEMPNPTGRGRICDNMPFDDWLRKHHRVIVDVDRNDNLCFVNALICGVIYKELENNPSDWGKFRKSIHNENSQKINNVFRDFWLPLNIDVSNGATIEKIKQVQEAIKNEFRLIIYTDRAGKGLLFTPTVPKSEHLTDISLYCEKNHIVFLKPNSLHTVFGFKYYCEFCRKGYQKIEYHRDCELRCSQCLDTAYCSGPERTCSDCKRTFKGDSCFQTHIERDICNLLRLCDNCGIHKVKNRKHECGKVYCKICFSLRELPHFCFVPTASVKKPRKSTISVYFDFECRQDDLVEGSENRYIHVPNLCVAFQKCPSCPDIDSILEIENNCDRCGERKHIFSKERVLEEFIQYLLNISTQFDEVIVISHNGKSYDNHFILTAILENGEIDNPEIILCGAQIYAIYIGKIKFIDSLNFFGCSLSKLPKMFGIQDLEKGYYPHLWNTKANETAAPALLPAKDFFLPKSMSEKDRIDFEIWHDTLSSQNFIFDNFRELVKYCINDVFILMQACDKFSTLFKQLSNFDVFPNSITIASACNKVFRTNFLKKDTISIIPRAGYRLRNKQSKIGLKWLFWIEYSKQIPNFEHAGRGRERRLLNKFYVDGFDPNGGLNGVGKVYEMLGCYWHGCPKCFGNKPATIDQLLDRNFDTHNSTAIRHEETMSRLNILRQHYEVEYVYECEFYVIQRSAEYRQFESQYSHFWEVEKINARDCLYGGRVNNVKTYAQADTSKSEKILYYDVTSLYPHVLKNRAFPIGRYKKNYHGANIDEFDINSMNGIVKIKILAPDNLYLPVLPVKMHNKLMFFLCFKCANEKSQDLCTHTDEERSFIGTYVIDEVRLAISKGYKILQVYEAWTYDMISKTNDETSVGLFGQYVNLFLKTKQEASGYPLWVTSDEDRKKYIESYKEHEGISLEPENIESNEGLRTLAKLCLNNFWGKFAENEERRMTVIIKEPHILNDYLTNETISVETIIPINDEILLLHYKFHEEDTPSLNFANVIIAAFTTAHARIELYSYLDRLKDRILYFDTDSIIFKYQPGDPEIELSDYLGGMTDELEKFGEGSYAVEFVSGGPKNYSLNIWSTRENRFVTICKAKGITLNSEAVKKINFESIKKMILEPDSLQEINITNEHKISRIVGLGVFTSKETKIYRPVFTKRVLDVDSYDTKPFGIKRRRI